MSKENRKRKATVLNPRGAGRMPMYVVKYGKPKRISITIPSKKEVEIRKEIDVILEPYKY